MIDQEAAGRLAAELMPIAVIVAGEGADALIETLAGAGVAAEPLAHADQGGFDLGILLATSPANSQPLAAALAQASERILLLPAPGEDAAPDLTAWFEIFAELGYQPVVEFDAGFLARGAFLVDRNATAAESDLGAFAERLSLGDALATSTQRVATLEAEIAGGERALQAKLAERDAECASLRQALATAEAQAAGAIAERDAQNAAWDSLRAWVRAAVSRPPAATPRTWRERLLGRKPNPLDADLALIRASPLFDAAWYIASNPELAGSAADPAHHYLTQGVTDPGPWFDAQAYLTQHPNLRETGENLLLHAIKNSPLALAGEEGAQRETLGR